MQLSDTQTAILTTAAAREDRMVFPIMLAIKGGAVGNVAKSLLKRGLIEEVVASDVHTVWRCGDDGKPLTLAITDAGIEAIGGSVERAAERKESLADQPVSVERKPRQRGAAQEALLALLRRPEGATIAELQAVTGWQPHSVRGALSGVVAKKLGYEVTSTKEERGRVYRIAR